MAVCWYVRTDQLLKWTLCKSLQELSVLFFLLYLIQPSKVPGLKGIPRPMSPRMRSPSASLSKATSYRGNEQKNGLEVRLQHCHLVVKG